VPVRVVCCCGIRKTNSRTNTCQQSGKQAVGPDRRRVGQCTHPRCMLYVLWQHRLPPQDDRGEGQDDQSSSVRFIPVCVYAGAFSHLLSHRWDTAGQERFRTITHSTDTSICSWQYYWRCNWYRNAMIRLLSRSARYRASLRRHQRSLVSEHTQVDPRRAYICRAKREPGLNRQQV